VVSCPVVHWHFYSPYHHQEPLCSLRQLSLNFIVAVERPMTHCATQSEPHPVLKWQAKVLLASSERMRKQGIEVKKFVHVSQSQDWTPASWIPALNLNHKIAHPLSPTLTWHGNTSQQKPLCNDAVLPSRPTSYLVVSQIWMPRTVPTPVFCCSACSGWDAQQETLFIPLPRIKNGC